MEPSEEDQTPSHSDVAHVSKRRTPGLSLPLNPSHIVRLELRIPSSSSAATHTLHNNQTIFSLIGSRCTSLRELQVNCGLHTLDGFVDASSTSTSNSSNCWSQLRVLDIRFNAFRALPVRPLVDVCPLLYELRLNGQYDTCLSVREILRWTSGAIIGHLEVDNLPGGGDEHGSMHKFCQAATETCLVVISVNDRLVILRPAWTSEKECDQRLDLVKSQMEMITKQQHESVTSKQDQRFFDDVLENAFCLARYHLRGRKKFASVGVSMQLREAALANAWYDFRVAEQCEWRTLTSSSSSSSSQLANMVLGGGTAGEEVKLRRLICEQFLVLRAFVTSSFYKSNVDDAGVDPTASPAATSRKLMMHQQQHDEEEVSNVSHDDGDHHHQDSDVVALPVASLPFMKSLPAFVFSRATSPRRRRDIDEVLAKQTRGSSASSATTLSGQHSTSQQHAAATPSAAPSSSKTPVTVISFHNDDDNRSRDALVSSSSSTPPPAPAPLPAASLSLSATTRRQRSNSGRAAETPAGQAFSPSLSSTDRDRRERTPTATTPQQQQQQEISVIHRTMSAGGHSVRKAQMPATMLSPSVSGGRATPAADAVEAAMDSSRRMMRAMMMVTMSDDTHGGTPTTEVVDNSRLLDSRMMMDDEEARRHVSPPSPSPPPPRHHPQQQHEHADNDEHHHTDAAAGAAAVFHPPWEASVARHSSGIDGVEFPRGDTINSHNVYMMDSRNYTIQSDDEVHRAASQLEHELELSVERAERVAAGLKARRRRRDGSGSASGTTSASADQRSRPASSQFRSNLKQKDFDQSSKPKVGDPFLFSTPAGMGVGARYIIRKVDVDAGMATVEKVVTTTATVDGGAPRKLGVKLEHINRGSASWISSMALPPPLDLPTTANFRHAMSHNFVEIRQGFVPFHRFIKEKRARGGVLDAATRVANAVHSIDNYVGRQPMQNPYNVQTVISPRSHHHHHQSESAAAVVVVHVGETTDATAATQQAVSSETSEAAAVAISREPSSSSSAVKVCQRRASAYRRQQQQQQQQQQHLTGGGRGGIDAAIAAVGGGAPMLHRRPPSSSASVASTSISASPSPFDQLKREQAVMFHEGDFCSTSMQGLRRSVSCCGRTKGAFMPVGVRGFFTSVSKASS